MFQGLTCTVDKVTEDSILDFLFGFDPSCVETDDHDCGTPNIGSILHAIGNWTWIGCPEFRGIATNLYETDWTVEEWNADLHVKYYWSDRELWSGTSGSGISVPVATEITGSAVDDNGVTVPVDETILYISFENVSEIDENQLNTLFIDYKTGWTSTGGLWANQRHCVWWQGHEGHATIYP